MNRASEVHLISFPKSGRTWLCLLIGRAIQQYFGFSEDKSLFIEYFHEWFPEKKIPKIVVQHDIRSPFHAKPHELKKPGKYYRGDCKGMVINQLFDASADTRLADTEPGGQFLVALSAVFHQQGDEVPVIAVQQVRIKFPVITLVNMQADRGFNRFYPLAVSYKSFNIISEFLNRLAYCRRYQVVSANDLD